MVSISCLHAVTQPIAGNWSGPRVQRNKSCDGKGRERPNPKGMHSIAIALLLASGISLSSFGVERNSKGRIIQRLNIFVKFSIFVKN